jgi:hypothetical protein
MKRNASRLDINEEALVEIPSRKRVQRLMRLIDVAAIYQHPRRGENGWCQSLAGRKIAGRM